MAGLLVAGGLGTALLVGPLAGGKSGQGPAATPARPGAVDPRDVAAAQACAAFAAYVNAAIGGSVPQVVYQRFVTTADALVAGARPGQPPPKWAALGSRLLSVGDDILHDNVEGLQSDDLAATELCDSIPPAAARAGGYTSQAGSP